MNDGTDTPFDSIVVGAGPVGCVAALAHANRGQNVLVLEANPNASKRLAGEWLHPPAVEILKNLGIIFSLADCTYKTGQGIAVYPDHANNAILLNYPQSRHGLGIQHNKLVSALRNKLIENKNITYLQDISVKHVNNGFVKAWCKNNQVKCSFQAHRIIIAGGRSINVTKDNENPLNGRCKTNMVGLLLKDIDLPDEGYGHLYLGANSPIMLYRIEKDAIRAIMDVPIHIQKKSGRADYIEKVYLPAISASLRPALKQSLKDGNFLMAANNFVTRERFGTGVIAHVGDAVGFYHPLTASGMTSGFQDAVVLSECSSVREYAKRRSRESRVSESVAVGLYRAFSMKKDDSIAIKAALVKLWRSTENKRTEALAQLSCMDNRRLPFLLSFLTVMSSAIISLLKTKHDLNRIYCFRTILFTMKTHFLWMINGAPKNHPISTIQDSLSRTQAVKDTHLQK